MDALQLAVRDLNFGYTSQDLIIRDWEHDFEGKEVVALTGPSGRGKSTLLYLLGLMLSPLSGLIMLDGENVGALNDAERAARRAQKYGFVFQDSALDPTRTVLDNVLETTLYRGVSREEQTPRALELLDAFGVSLRATHKPGQISGGQAQRIALCRALLSTPQVLLCDEPTGNLDAASASSVISGIRDHAASGAIVIIATHDPFLMDHCDRRVELT